jgi:hypothetical protein
MRSSERVCSVRSLLCTPRLIGVALAVVCLLLVGCYCGSRDDLDHIYGHRTRLKQRMLLKATLDDGRSGDNNDTGACSGSGSGGSGSGSGSGSDDGGEASTTDGLLKQMAEKRRRVAASAVGCVMPHSPRSGPACSADACRCSRG